MAKRPMPRTVSASSVGGHEDAGHDLRVASAAAAPSCDDRRHRGHVVGRQPVDDGAVALAAGEPQHALAQRGHQDRHRLLGGTTPSLKPRTENVSYSAVTFSPVSAWRRKRTMSRVRL